MLRSELLFFAALLLALTAGRALWVWLDQEALDMSRQTHVEFQARPSFSPSP